MLRQDLKSWPILSMLESEMVSTIRMVLIYGSLGNEALIVTKDDMVYAMGYNNEGCLGIGDMHSTFVPKAVEALCKIGIKTLAQGNGPHLLALSEKGQVYSWGRNANHELGTGDDCPQFVPSLIPINRKLKFVDVACGNHHSLALTDDGKVYAWGRNDHNQSGDSTQLYQPVPKEILYTLADKKVVCISCSQSSSIAVTDEGDVYSWGSNEYGQLGNGDSCQRKQPCKAKFPHGIIIKKVVCGFEHILALSNKGELYVWGANQVGQLGLGHKSHCSTPVQQVQDRGIVLDIAACHHSNISIAMNENNTVFMWGQCLGQSVTVPIVAPLTCMHSVFLYFAYPRVMHKPLICRNENEGMSLTEHVKEAFDDPTTSDLIIRVQGKPIQVHKAILKIRCQYFRTMFQEHWKENDQNVLEHDQFSYDVYKAFLKYLYTDEIDLPVENVLELLELANTYLEDGMKRSCLEVLKRGIAVENVALLYQKARQYNIEELEERCLNYALTHMTAVTQTPHFVALDESTLKTFIARVTVAGAFKT